MKRILFFLVFSFSFSYSFGQSWLWAKSAGGTGNDWTYGTACDSHGNVYVVGIFYGPSIKFGSYVFNNAGNGDLFLVKYDPSGNIIWAKSAGGTGYDLPDDIFVDINDNVYICGEFSSPTLVFGSFTLLDPTGDDFFAVKYDSAGTVLWANTGIVPYNPLGAKGIRADKEGNVYVTGLYESPSLRVGSFTLTNVSSGVQGDIFLIKYNKLGNVIWAKSYGGRMDDRAEGIAIDGKGNVLITGGFSSDTLKFGSFTLINDTTNNSEDVFIVKSDSLGNVIWAKSAGGTGWDVGIKVSTDYSNNILVSGDFYSRAFYISNDTLINPIVDSSELFLSKLDPNGNAIWSKAPQGTGIKYNAALFVDSGNVYITGAFTGPFLVFGKDTIQNAGRKDIYFTNYDTAGNVIWAIDNGGSFDDWGSGIVLDKNGNTYLTGYFNDPAIIFGIDTLINDTTDNTSDIFLAKMGNTVLTNIQNILEPQKITVFPNPTTGIFTISLAGAQNFEPKNIDIYNVLGEKVNFVTLRQVQGDYTLNISSQPNSIYFYRVVSENGSLVGEGKVVIEK